MDSAVIPRPPQPSALISSDASTEVIEQLWQEEAKPPLLRIGELLHSRCVSSSVVECWDEEKLQFVAIKVFTDVQTESGRRECLILKYMAKLDGAGAYYVQMQNYFDHYNHLCIVFEKLGPTLDCFIYKSFGIPLFDGVTVQNLGRQLLECVAFLHDNLVVHTDLKPENVLFTSPDCVEMLLDNSSKGPVGLKYFWESKVIKLIDFGCSVVDDSSGPFHYFPGTPPYSAPEVLLGLEWSFPCDIWSVGCILFEILFVISLFRLLVLYPFLLEIRIGKSECFKWTLAHWPEIAQRKNVEQVQRMPTLNDYAAVKTHRIPAFSDYINLLQCLFKYEPSERLTAREALAHPFFNK
ncbi:hypothetical protein IFM89_026982, partial [Coptis chinensis]